MHFQAGTSYYNRDGTAVSEEGGMVRTEDERKFKSNEGSSYRLEGKGWIAFDKRDPCGLRHT